MNGYLSPALEGVESRYINADFNRERAEQDIEFFGCTDLADWQYDRMTAMGNMRPYGAVYPVYSKAKVLDFIKRMDDEGGWIYRRLKHKKNQLREGTCVYNMAAHLMQIAWNTQFGDDKAVSLSPVSGYRWNAPGPNTGSNVADALTWCMTTGLLPTDNPENKAKFKHVHPDTGYYSPFMPGWKTTAGCFKIHEGLYVRTVEEWWASIINGHGCGGGRDGHAIGHVGLARDGNSILSIYIQSWYMPWGFALDTAAGKLTTFGADSEAKVRVMTQRGAWTIHSMVRPTFLAI